MQYWLSRAAFSFVILAAFMAWEGYKAGEAVIVDQQRQWLFWCGAAIFAGLGMAGISARHREEK